MNPQRTNNHTITLLLALAIFCTGWLGMMLPAFGSTITLIWMPTGIAVAVMFQWGFGCWPGLALGGTAANLAIGTPWPVVLGIAVGNVLAPMLTAWTLRRVGFHPAFDRSRDILLLAGAAALGMLVSSSLGVTALSLGGIVREGRLAAWLTWWAGDSMGVILAAPLVFALMSEERRVILRRGAEFFTWLGVICAVTWGVFVFNRGSDGQPWALAFLPLPLLVWGTLRFGGAGTSLAVIVLAVGAAYGTATGRGPFFRANPMEGVIVLWIYMATNATLGWLISALQAKRDQSVGIQRLFEQALSDVSLGVLLAGLDRRITYANHGFTQLTGYTEAEMLGKSCALLQGPETAPATGEKLKAALHAEGFFDGEILNYRKDGTAFWNALLVSPVRDERGVMTGFLGIQRDITKRKQAELALHQSEEHLRTIIELEPECVKIMSPEGKLLEMNPAGLAMIEAGSLEEVRGCPLTELIVPEDRPAFTEMHHRAMQGATGRCEFSIVTLKGTRRWLETHAVPYRNAQREIIGVLGITRDISERKLAENALRRSETQFRTLADNLPDVVARFDRDRRHLYINPAAEAATGLKPEAFTGKTNEDLGMPQENTAIWKALLDRVFVTGADERIEFSYPGPTGMAFWESHVVAERGADGEIESALVLSRDITQLRQAELARQEALGRLQKIASQLPGVVYQFRLRPDGTSCFPFASEAMHSIYRVSPEEIREEASKVFAILHPDDRDSITASIQASARDLTPWRHEYRVKFPDGTTRWLYGNSLPQREANGGTLWHGFITDITERKQAQIERELLDRKMQETQKLESLGVLAGGIAHDFNNLLTAILGNASLAQIELPTGSSAQDCLEQINEAALRAADLCKQMLAYSGRGRFVVQKLDLGALVEQTAQMLQISISKKAVLRYHLEKGLPPVEADATQIRQVIMNLVLNASEAIGDQSGVISVTTGLTRVDRDYLHGTLMDPDLPAGDYVFLEVSDSGCGMSAETQARIFDPFFTTKFTGRGLGLAAVLGIVRGHKGALKVYSEAGRGTTFKLLFPAAGGASETAQAPPAAVPEWHGAGTVLVVDDEETMRSTVARMLRKLGLETVLACDGREAVEIFRAQPAQFTLVLLDLTMPHMDGEQAFTELRRLRPDVRVVLMSGFNAQEAVMRFTGKGLASFLQKPFTMDTLRSVLQTVLD